MNKVMAAEFRLFLPNESIITGVAGLARMYRPSAVDRAAEGYHDWLRLAGPGSSHRQLTLRADRSAERPACGALISRPTAYDVPGLRFGHWPTCAFLVMKVWLTLVEETSRYVPANVAPAVGGGGVCASAAASEAANATIQANPT